LVQYIVKNSVDKIPIVFNWNLEADSNGRRLHLLMVFRGRNWTKICSLLDMIVFDVYSGRLNYPYQITNYLGSER